MCERVSVASLMLLLDLPKEKKEKLLVGFVQVGIDQYEIYDQTKDRLEVAWGIGGGFGSGRKPPHFSTVWRWATVGCRGARLETVRVGRVLFTSPAAIREFVAAMSAADGPPAPGAGRCAPPARRQTLSKARAAAQDYWQRQGAAP